MNFPEPSKTGEEAQPDTSEYQKFLADCAKRCRCTREICGGVLAGGLCDEMIEEDDEFYNDRSNFPNN